jgi:LCP family protein required for cell wall assembly
MRSSVAPPSRRFFRLRNIILCSILGFTLGAGGFIYAEFVFLRSSVIIRGESTSNNLLDMTTSNSKSVDWSKFHHLGDGRVNIAVLGIGGTTDTGQVHDGALLTDSIQIMSIDTIHKSVSMTSVPRDFYYKGNKINSVYAFAEAKSPGSGGAAVKAALGDVLGITIPHFVVVDFTAAKEAVNTVGGVDILVPTAISDPTYPAANEVGYDPFYISNGMHHMDGTLALKYMRTRHSYNDFGRSKRQQVVMSAVKAKILSLGVLTNPLKISQLVASVGNHVKTDLQMDEIQSLIALYKDVPASAISTQVLDTTPQLGLLLDKMDSFAGYVEMPVLGPGKFDSIHEWFWQHSPDPLLSQEGATVTVAPSGRTTLKQLTAFIAKLNAAGFQATAAIATTVSTPHATTTLGSQIYTSKTTDPVTVNYLQSLLGTQSQSGSPLNSGSDIEILYSPNIITGW